MAATVWVPLAAVVVSQVTARLQSSVDITPVVDALQSSLSDSLAGDVQSLLAQLQSAPYAALNSTLSKAAGDVQHGASLHVDALASSARVRCLDIDVLCTGFVWCVFTKRKPSALRTW